jgi:TonB family protein
VNLRRKVIPITIGIIVISAGEGWPFPQATHIQRAIQEKVNFFSFYPEKALEEKWEGVVLLGMIINRKGGVEDLFLMKSSGYPLLDDVAKWVVKNAEPYPLPPDFQREKLFLTIPMQFGEKPPQEEILISEEEYFATLSRILNSFLFYPQEARKQKIEGKVGVKFIINQMGRVKKAEILQSSGNPLLDKAALLTLQKAQPYPSPRLVGKGELEVTLPIQFKYKPTELAGLLLTLGEEEKAPPKPSELEIKKDDIRELFELAEKNSYPLKIAKDQIDLAKIKVKETIRNLFPALGIEYTQTEGETLTDTYKSRSYGIKVQHILYDSKQRTNSLRREKINVEVAEENYKKERDKLLFELLKNYYIFHKEKQALSLLENSQENFDNYFNLGITLKEGKLITQIEFLKIQNIYNKMRAELVAQKSRYTLSVANLKKVAGIEPEEPLPQLSLVEFKEDIILDDFISDYIKKGLTLRSEIKLWEKSIEATALGYEVAKVENRPKFLLESFWGRSGEAFGHQSLDLAETWNIIGKVVWLFGGSSFETSLTKEKATPTEFAQVSYKTEADTLSLKMNLLDKLRYYTETQEGKVALKQAQDEFIKIKKDIAWEVQEGFFTYTEARRRIESVKKELETHLKELELKRELFKAGEIGLSDVMHTELRTLEAQLSLLKAKLDMYLGIITLDKATGFNLNLIEKL